MTKISKEIIILSFLCIIIFASLNIKANLNIKNYHNHNNNEKKIEIENKITIDENIIVHRNTTRLYDYENRSVDWIIFHEYFRIIFKKKIDEITNENNDYKFTFQYTDGDIIILFKDIYKNKLYADLESKKKLIPRQLKF